MKKFLNGLVIMFAMLLHDFMVKSRLMCFLFEDIAGIDGNDNMAGVQRKAYFCPIDDITTLPGYVAAPATMANYAEIQGNFTLAVGKNFWEITIEPATGKIEDAAIEGEGNNSMESTYEFFIPGNRTQHLGFIRKVLNTKGVWIVPEADGNYRILGIKPGVPAITSANTTTGVNSEGQKGTTLTVKSIQNGPAPVFNGIFELDNSASITGTVGY